MDDRITVDDYLQHEVFSWTPEFVYFKILWTIPDFLKAIEGVEYPNYIGSSNALPIIHEKFSVNLCFCLKFDDADEDPEPCFYFRNEIQDCNIWNAFRLTVLDKNGEELIEMCSGKIANIAGGVWGYPKVFSSKAEMIQRIDGSLNISVQGISWVDQPKVKEIPLDLLRNKVASAPIFLELQEYSDVIISVEKEQFHVHKRILHSASSVFQEMFKIQPGNIIVISNVTSTVFRVIVHFIYKGTFEAGNSDDLLMDLFEASHNYKISLLKYICEMKLMKIIKVCNVVRLLKISNEAHALELEECCTKFIIKNRKIVSLEQSWKDFTSEPCELNLKLFTRFMESD